jgi:hypothetical protein
MKAIEQVDKPLEEYNVAMDEWTMRDDMSLPLCSSFPADVVIVLL